MTALLERPFCRRVSAAVAGAGLTAGAMLGVANPASAGTDATARVYFDDGNKIAAEGKFESYGDRFELTKKSSHLGNRPYLEYKYIRKDGTLQEGTHWGVSQVGNTVYFDHNFGEGRAVAFRVCVQIDWWPDACSDDDDGQWAKGYA